MSSKEKLERTIAGILGYLAQTEKSANIRRAVYADASGDLAAEMRARTLAEIHMAQDLRRYIEEQS